MANNIFIAFAAPASGREDDFNEWYENTHIGDCLAVDGFVSAKRYRLHANQAGEAPANYVTIYELADDQDPAEVIERLNAAVPGMVIAADTIDFGALNTHTWTATSVDQDR